MTPDHVFWWQIAGIVLAGLGLAMISFMEAALVSISRVRLRQLIDDGHPTAPLVGRLVSHPQELLGALVIMINAFVLLAANLTTAIASRLPYGGGLVIWANLLVLIGLLFFGEIAPKTISVHFAEQVALRTARLAYIVNVLLMPLVAVLNGIALVLLRILTALRILPGQVRAAPTAFTEEDIKQLVTAGEQSGEVEALEREMIHGVIGFAETNAYEVMIPRTELVTLSDDASIAEAIETFMASGHSRIPVYHESVDDIIGLLYIKDILIRLSTVPDEEALPPITAMLRPAYFVPESKKSDELLRELQRKQVHLAIVVDEYGGTAGIITIEDLLEEIVGDIIDEYDQERLEIAPLAGNMLLVSGQTSLEKIAETFDIPIPDTDAETLSGLISEQLGRIPAVGEKTVINGVEFTVTKVAHNRAEQFHAVVLQQPEPPDEP